MQVGNFLSELFELLSSQESASHPHLLQQVGCFPHSCSSFGRGGHSFSTRQWKASSLAVSNSKTCAELSVTRTTFKRGSFGEQKMGSVVRAAVQGNTPQICSVGVTVDGSIKQLGKKKKKSRGLRHEEQPQFQSSFSTPQRDAIFKLQLNRGIYVSSRINHVFHLRYLRGSQAIDQKLCLSNWYLPLCGDSGGRGSVPIYLKWYALKERGNRNSLQVPFTSVCWTRNLSPEKAKSLQAGSNPYCPGNGGPQRGCEAQGPAGCGRTCLYPSCSGG